MEKIILTPERRGDIIDTLRENNRFEHDPVTSGVYVTVIGYIRDGYDIARIRDLMWGNCLNLESRLQAQMKEHKPLAMLQESAELYAVSYALYLYMYRFTT